LSGAIALPMSGPAWPTCDVVKKHRLGNVLEVVLFPHALHEDRADHARPTYEYLPASS